MNLLRDRPRYQESWVGPFEEAAREVLRPGIVVLDVGGGRHPAFARASLPDRSVYVGLDLSAEELSAAPSGSYDRAVQGDIRVRLSELDGTVDLAVSWQVLEHVKPLQDAVDNIHAYLRPGGRFVAQLSGGRAFFALANRLIPDRIAVAGMKRLLGRDPKTVFPACYDNCTYTGLTRAFRQWSRVVVVPRYRGAYYLSFFPPVQWAYLKVEDRMAFKRHLNLATHYLVIAER